MASHTSTQTVTVNAAFLQEIKDVNRELIECLEKLRALCSRPISLRGHCRGFVDSLVDLRDQLALHFALEESYGYFDNPLDVAPDITERASVLRQQHRTLYQRLDALTDAAETLFCQRRLAELTTIIPVAFDRFAEQLEQHEQDESTLLQEAWIQDIGVGD